MEDNEFEEVTIISHTSEEPSDLTLRKAREVCASKISIEATQTVSKTVNSRCYAKVGESSKTYLDLLHERFLKSVSEQAIFFISEVRFGQHSGRCRSQPCLFVGTDTKALLFDPFEQYLTEITSTSEKSGSVFYVFQWGEFLCELRSEQKIRIFREGVLVNQTKSAYDGVTNQHVKFTQHHMYFFSKKWWLIRMSRDFHEMIIVKKRIQDFEVSTSQDPKDEIVTVLDGDGNISRKNESTKIAHNWEDGEFDTIKATYSSQYLVCEGNHDRKTSLVHLLRVKDLKLMDSLQLPGTSTEMTVAIRVTAPRRGLEMFLLERDKVIYVGGIFRHKLYNVTSVNLNFTIMWIAYVAGDWMIVGPDPNITSLKLRCHF